MKNCYALLCCLLLNLAWAQNADLQFPSRSTADFSCTNPPGCIENPSLDDAGLPSGDGWLSLKSSWYTSHGSPTPGTSSVWLWSYGGGGEGMYTCFNFESGKQYKLCLTIRTDNPPGSLGYENQDAKFYIQATNGNFNIPTNPDSQVIAAWHAVDQVETSYTYTFTANANYNKLWLFPYMLVHAPTPVDQYSMNTFEVKVEEVAPTPTVSLSGNTLTVTNSPSGGHWSWTPSTLVANANANGSIVTLVMPCTPMPITGNFISDCSICSNYTLQANVNAPLPDTNVINSGPACEGNAILLNVTNPDTSLYNYQWLQIIGTEAFEINNDATYSGVNTPALSIVASANLDGAQFICMIAAISGNCLFDTQTATIHVFQNPPVPTATAVNPTGAANGSILINSPVANTILYSLNGAEPQFNPLFENLAAGTYEVSAINGSGCKSTILVTLTQPVPLTGMIPKGISPNGDGENDAFDLSGIGNISQVKIFNRYGVNVYSKAHYLNEWKGQTDRGLSLPTATYYYVIFFENGDAKTGWVYLQRNI